LKFLFNGHRNIGLWVFKTLNSATSYVVCCYLWYAIYIFLYLWLPLVGSDHLVTSTVIKNQHSIPNSLKGKSLYAKLERHTFFFTDTSSPGVSGQNAPAVYCHSFLCCISSSLL